MIKVEVDALRKGDHIRFAKDKGLEYVLARNPEINTSDSSLRILTWSADRAVQVPEGSLVYAVKMIRTVMVPCLLHRGDVELLYDAASGATPHAVLCGDCDEKTTAEVLRLMAEKEGA